MRSRGSALDAERVENRDSVGNACGQCIGACFPRLVASALAAVIGKDLPELIAQRSGEARCLRNLQWIRESGVEEDRRPRAARVLEVRADAIDGVGREWHRVCFPARLTLHPPAGAPRNSERIRVQR
jgi:hypothetical protein